MLPLLARPRKCSLDPPFEPELKFVAELVIRKEELSHLPLLGHLVRLRNWIFDRLDGALPKKDLEKPLKVLLEDAMEKDRNLTNLTNLTILYIFWTLQVTGSLRLCHRVSTFSVASAE